MKALHQRRVGRRRVAPTGSGAGRDPYDRELSDLVGELSTRSELFSAMSPMQTTTYGAERTQPVAIGGKSESRENGSNKPNPLPPIADSCEHNEMVRNAMKKGLPRRDAPRVLVE